MSHGDCLQDGHVEDKGKWTGASKVLCWITVMAM